MDLTPDQIAKATGCPSGNVAEHWPNILTALKERGIGHLGMQIAAAATVRVESAAFLPIKERRANPKRQPKLYALQEKYWPSGYFGRGFIQLTWGDNYRKIGKEIGIDLVNNPDNALEPVTAAKVLAHFICKDGIVKAAESDDWVTVRKLINGGRHGLEDFLDAVKKLKHITSSGG